MTQERIKPTGCCEIFDPKPWDGKTFEWKKKLFVVDKVWCFFYMPVNFGAVITRLMKKVNESGAKIVDGMCLSDHTSKWSMKIMVAVDKEVEELTNTSLSGKFVSKVYEGDFKETGKWCADFEGYLKSKKFKMKKMYMWYTTCPKCAKVYGKNYTVLVAKVEG